MLRITNGRFTSKCENGIKRFEKEWNSRFQGVNRSNKTAFASDSVEVAALVQTMRDMDYVQGRQYLRNAVMEHYGVPREIMGISESSNRAVSDAARAIYAQNVQMPKLRRREEAINKQLLPLFGDPSIFWKYDEIIPRNEEFDKAKALDAWNAGLLLKNEARELIGLPAVDGGDIYKTTYADVFIGANDDPTAVTDEMATLQYADGASGGETRLLFSDRAYALRQRKQRQCKAMGEVSQRNIAQAAKEQQAHFEIAINKYFRKQANIIGKALVPAVKADAMNDAWTPLHRFLATGDDPQGAVEWEAMSDEARQSVLDSFVDGLLDWSTEALAFKKILEPLWRKTYERGADAAKEAYRINAIQRPELASTARLMGGRHITNIEETTKKTIGEIVAQGIENGDSTKTVAASIQDKVGNDRKRAQLIARQETNVSLTMGEYDMMTKAGFQWKVWHHVPQRNPRVDHSKMDGERVPINAKFSNGLRVPRDPESNDASAVIECKCWVSYE